MIYIADMAIQMSNFDNFDIEQMSSKFTHTSLHTWPQWFSQPELQFSAFFSELLMDGVTDIRKDAIIVQLRMPDSRLFAAAPVAV